LDAIVVVSAAIATYLGVAGVLFILKPWRFHFPRVPFQVGLACTLALLIGYLTVAWTMSGRSYGAHVMGLRVVGRSGRRVQAPIALARAALSVVLPAGLLWCTVSSGKRSVQDLLFGTSVVYDWRSRSVTAEDGEP
jgi:uncharacterized RDD family membrane protein YckC